MFFVYVLRNEITGQLYIGSCFDLHRRLAEHNRRKKGYKLIYKETRATKTEAVQREMYLKTGNGRRALKNLLAGVDVGSPAALQAGERLQRGARFPSPAPDFPPMQVFVEALCPF